MKIEYPKWIYPDGDVARGYLVHCAEDDPEKAPAINGDTSGDPEDVSEPPLVLPVLDAPPKNKGGRPRKAA